MNILLINHYAGSIEMGMEFRPYYLATKWIRERVSENWGGYTQVSIIAASYSHLRHDNPDVKHDFQKEDVDGIHYYWVKTKKYKRNGVARAIGMAQFVGKIIFHARELCEEIDPDVVIATSTYPLDVFAARKIRSVSGAKYIHEIHDMWPATLIEIGGMSKWHPFVILNQIAENMFCKYADAVVSIPPCTKEYLMKHGMAESKFHHIPNGIVKEDWEVEEPLPKEHQNAIDQMRSRKTIIIGFAGSHHEAYGLIYLIKAVRLLQKKQVGVIFVGDGYLKQQLIDQTAKERDTFVFLPAIRKSQIPTFMRQMDALYVSGVKDNLFRFGISMNKLMDSMMAGRPILYAVNAPNNYIEEYKCGISVPPRNYRALADGIQRLLAMSEQEREEMGKNGNRAALANFEYSVLAEEFRKLM